MPSEQRERQQRRTYTLTLWANVRAQGVAPAPQLQPQERSAVAIFHLAAQIIGRGAGRSATAAAAYRLGMAIHDERTGQRYDYSRKRGVDGWRIIGPEGMPEPFRNPARLWNAVEAAEKRQDAQLCRELNVALPRELTPQQNTALVLDWCQYFADAGMIACAAFHHLDDENPHAHIMLTLRAITPEGFSAKVRAWNDRQVLDRWRETWAEMVNTHLAFYRIEARVDHRTLEVQGVDRVPTQHQGPTAHAMEKRGAVPDRLRVIVPTPPTMNHAQAVEDVVRERHEPSPEPLPPHVRQALAEVAHARHAHQATVIEETQRRKAEQRAALERSEKHHAWNADRHAHHAAEQRAHALRQEAQAHRDAIERWKRRHRLRLWLWHRGIKATITAAVRQAHPARAQAKQHTAKAERDSQTAAAFAMASQGRFAQADNAYQHCARALREAQQRVAEAAEQVRHAEARWAEAWAPNSEPRHAQRQAADRHPDAPTPTRQRMRRR